MNLAGVLAELVDRLHERGSCFALVGGLAASLRGEVRFTRDIDIAVAVTDDSEAEQLVHWLSQKGFAPIATVEHEVNGRLATARLQHQSAVVCDLIFATCGIEHEIVTGAGTETIFGGTLIPTATAEALLAMKVLSATPRRPADLGDILAIAKANPTFDEALVREYLTLIGNRGFARRQDLLMKWEDYVSSFGLSPKPIL